MLYICVCIIRINPIFNQLLVITPSSFFVSDVTDRSPPTLELSLLIKHHQGDTIYHEWRVIETVLVSYQLTPAALEIILSLNN